MSRTKVRRLEVQRVVNFAGARDADFVAFRFAFFLGKQLLFQRFLTGSSVQELFNHAGLIVSACSCVCSFSPDSIYDKTVVMDSEIIPAADYAAVLRFIREMV